MKDLSYSSTLGITRFSLKEVLEVDLPLFKLNRGGEIRDEGSETTIEVFFLSRLRTSGLNRLKRFSGGFLLYSFLQSLLTSYRPCACKGSLISPPAEVQDEMEAKSLTLSL